MALWAFHNNPGIGGFGESNPILFGGSKVRAEKKRNAALGTKKRGSNRRNTVSPISNDYYVGQGDLICQIVKELVDNAVDACRSPASDGDILQNEHQKRRIRVDIRSFHDTEGIDEESQVQTRVAVKFSSLPSRTLDAEWRIYKIVSMPSKPARAGTATHRPQKFRVGGMESD